MFEFVEVPRVMSVDLIATGGHFKNAVTDAYLAKYGIKSEPLFVAQLNVASKPIIDCYYGDDHYLIELGATLTDGASIPKIPGIYEALKLLQPMAAIPHDWFYRLKTNAANCLGKWYKNGVEQNERFPFELANKLYRDLLMYYGVSRAKAIAEYLGLEIGGRFSYDKYKEVENVCPTNFTLVWNQKQQTP